MNKNASQPAKQPSCPSSPENPQTALPLNEQQRQQWLEWDRDHVWHPFTQMKDYHDGEEPLLFTHAKGSWLYSGETRYLDAVASMWTNTLGHRHPALDKALTAQLNKAAHTTLLGATHPAAIALARQLTALAPPGLGHVFFSDNGSTAVEVAVKMAYQVKARQHEASGAAGPPPSLFLTFDGAYHGDTLGCVSVGGVDVFHAEYKPLLFPSHRLPYPAWPPPSQPHSNAARQRFLRRVLGDVEALVIREKHRLVGVVMEPGLQAAGGMFLMVPGFLKGLSKILKRHGLLLILDEIATGFCRLGPWLVCLEEGVTPDLLALGKGLTGGYLPLSATLATGEVYRAFLDDYEKARHFFHGHTFTGNPLAAAVSLENLRQMQKPAFQTGLRQRMAAFAQAIAPLGDHPLVGQVRLKGFAAGLDLMRDKTRGVPFAWGERVGHRAALLLRDQEIFMRPLGSTVVLMPPLCLKTGESRFLARGLGHVFDQIWQETKQPCP